jgi:uncharacterized protein
MAIASEAAQPIRHRLLLGPAAYVPRTPWRPLGALIAAGLIAAAGILAALVLLGPRLSAGTVPTGRDSETALLTLAVWQTATVALTLGASALFGGKILDVLALRAPAGQRRVYVVAIFLLFVLQAALSAVQDGVFSHDMYADLRPFVQLLGGPEWLLALFVVGIGAPLSEELLFRGFLLSALAKSRLGFAGAAVVSSALWTSLHAGYTLHGIIEVFTVGLFFSWLLWRTGSLRVAIFCHALYNSLLVVVLRHVPLPT